MPKAERTQLFKLNCEQNNTKQQSSKNGLQKPDDSTFSKGRSINKLERTQLKEINHTCAIGFQLKPMTYIAQSDVCKIYLRNTTFKNYYFLYTLV